ncbi:hypothetical protein ABW20_dc0104800 [Dactylellina cionopaga]|nr:hypothetical protein ABW20_dc0104800 [Dactylellina cionopaga]
MEPTNPTPEEQKQAQEAIANLETELAPESNLAPKAEFGSNANQEEEEEPKSEVELNTEPTTESKTDIAPKEEETEQNTEPKTELKTEVALKEEEGVELPYYEIDSKGDAFATCYLPQDDTGPIAVFRVSSKALTLASPILQDMIESSNKEEQSTDDTSTIKKISFNTRSFDEALIVMNIIHHQNSLNPKSITLTELHEIASFCDAYQFQDAVIPSADSWMKSIWPGPSSRPIRDLVKVGTAAVAKGKQTILPLHKTEGVETHCAGDCVRWLWIAHVFGYRKVFEECGHAAVFNIRMKNPAIPSFEVDGIEFEPGLSAFVQVEQLVGLIEGKVSKFQNSMSRNTGICKAKGNTADQCDVYQLGKLFKLKLKLGFPDNELKSQSLTEICNTFGETFRGTVDPSSSPQGYGFDGSHKNCDVFEDLQEAVCEIEGLDLRQMFQQ